MPLAIKQATLALKRGQIPVGAAVISANGEVLAKGYNSHSKCDLHAELKVLKSAAHKINSRLLEDCSIYITMEPCPMCAYAICLYKIKNIYFGCCSQKTGGLGGCVNVVSAIGHKPNMYGGIMEDECSNLMKEFFKTKR